MARFAAAASMSTFVVRTEAADRAGERKVIDVRIEGRRVVEPKGSIRVVKGDVVELRWMSDEPVELHLHGYDIELNVRRGKPAAMVVRARATGRFPITSHRWGSHGHSHGHDALTYLEVHPR